MLNHYPLWKYIVLITTVFVGFLYALPNLYGKDPSVQIRGTHSTTVNERTLIQVQKILQEDKIITKSLVLENGIILARFYSTDMQFRAREILTNSLSNEHILALNFTPTTPRWLSSLSAEPMKLGLDLCGGIYFLIEVDTATVLDKLQEQNINNLLSDLNKKGIPYVTCNKENNHGVSIIFHDRTSRDQAMSYLTVRHRNLTIFNQGDNQIQSIMTDSYLERAREHAVQKNISILRNRINHLGITESLVQRQGINRIAVELPGILDTTCAKEILGSTATLEFRLVNTKADKFIGNSECIPDDSELKQTREGQFLLLYKHVILTGDHIIDSTVSQDEYNQPQVNISLDSEGANIMSKFTENAIGKPMVTLFTEYKDSGEKDANGRTILVKKEEVINIANIQSRLSNNFRITGINNQNEAYRLSLLLRAGQLVTPVQIVEERIIGPTLGIQNIRRGIKACLVSLVSSIIFIIFLYKKFGLIATTALVTNLILIIGIMSLLPGATLTMPGIAGIVLTLAVAVDANVLINERIKEELNNGRSVQQAINEGYKSAFSSIFDANIMTLIKVIILYEIGSDVIKGFAITTGIGIVTSMFTSIIGTRAIVNLLYGGKRIRKLSI